MSSLSWQWNLPASCRHQGQDFHHPLSPSSRPIPGLLQQGLWPVLPRWFITALFMSAEHCPEPWQAWTQMSILIFRYLRRRLGNWCCRWFRDSSNWHQWLRLKEQRWTPPPLLYASPTPSAGDAGDGLSFTILQSSHLTWNFSNHLIQSAIECEIQRQSCIPALRSFAFSDKGSADSSAGCSSSFSSTLAFSAIVFFFSALVFFFSASTFFSSAFAWKKSLKDSLSSTSGTSIAWSVRLRQVVQYTPQRGSGRGWLGESPGDLPSTWLFFPALPDKCETMVGQQLELACDWDQISPKDRNQQQTHPNKQQNKQHPHTSQGTGQANQ